MVKYALFKCNHGVTLGFYTNTKGTEHLHEHGWVNNSYITAYKAFILAFWNVQSIRHSLNSRERVFSLYRFLVLESNPRVLSIKERKIREETTWRNNGKVRESHDQRKEKEGLKRKWKKNWMHKASLHFLCAVSFFFIQRQQQPYKVSNFDMDTIKPLFLLWLRFETDNSVQLFHTICVWFKDLVVVTNSGLKVII